MATVLAQKDQILLRFRSNSKIILLGVEKHCEAAEVYGVDLGMIGHSCQTQPSPLLRVSQPPARWSGCPKSEAVFAEKRIPEPGLFPQSPSLSSPVVLRQRWPSWRTRRSTLFLRKWHKIQAMSLHGSYASVAKGGPPEAPREAPLPSLSGAVSVWSTQTHGGKPTCVRAGLARSPAVEAGRKVRVNKLIELCVEPLYVTVFCRVSRTPRFLA